jgi:putative restriction endonuclease
MPSHLDDKRVRLAAFRWLEQQVAQHGDVLARGLLLDGFELDGQRIPLMSQQGIFKPKVLSQIPLSITTTPHGPYGDQLGPEGLLLYSYRGTDPHHHENAGLRTAMLQGTPLIYLYGLVPGKYVPVWPVFIVGDDPQRLMFNVAVDDQKYLDAYSRAESQGLSIGEPQDAGRRQYITTLVRQRLHQRGFRERVLEAYQEQCALCRLRHDELLDAAHIIPDGEPGGEPVVENGIALCKLHHAAFDSFFLGIRPDYTVEVRRDILEEHDGPMLTHGLQGLHDIRILLPRSLKSRPSPQRLEARYDRFLRLGQDPRPAADGR